MRKRTQLALLVLLSLVLFFLRLGSESVYQVAEARNAECAREMLTRKDWIVPLFNGQLRTDKPALEYFAMITAYKIAGVSEGAARFFSALCGVLLILVTFLFVSRHLGQTAGWWAALCLLASPHLIFQFRLATPDPYLILLDTLALYAFFEGRAAYRSTRAKRPWRWYALTYAFLGLAMLAKGPVGILLPGAAIFIFTLLKREFSWQTIRQWKPWWGLFILAACCTPWYVLVHLNTAGAWTRGFFLEHNLGRFGGAMGGHGGIFLITFAFVTAGMLPFSVFAVHSLGQAWKDRKSGDLLLFSLVSFSVIIIFYAVSRTKLINYTVPCYPLLAIMTGYVLMRFQEAPATLRKLSIPFLVLGIITSVFPVGVYLWTRTQPILYPFWWISLCMLLYPAGSWYAYLMCRRGKITRSLSVVVATFVLGTLMLFAGPYPALDTQTPLRKAQSLFSPGRPVAAYRHFNNAFVFYAGNPIPVLKDTGEVRTFLATHPDALIITKEKHPQALQAMANLEEIRNDPEIFNSHPSRIFRQRPVFEGENHKTPVTTESLKQTH